MGSADSRPLVCFVSANVFDRLSNSAGGSEMQILNLAETLSSDCGWRVAFAAQEIGARSADRGALPGPLSTFPGSARYKWLSWIVLAVPTIRATGADVFYQRGAFSLTVATAIAARRNRRPWVWAVASDADCTPEAFRRRHFGSASRSWLRALRRLTSWVRARMLGRARSPTCRQAGRAACASDTARSRRCGSRGRMRIVRNGHHVFALASERPRDTICWIGGLKPSKRPKLFEELAACLCRSGVADTLEFVLAGRAFGQPWQSWSESLGGLGSPLRYAGELAHDDVLALLARSQFLVSTSELEGFPNTFIEAWLSATPVLSIGFDPDGLIAERGLGIVADTVPAACAAASNLLADPDRLAEMRLRCREYAASEHDIATTAASVDAALRAASDAVRGMK